MKFHFKVMGLVISVTTVLTACGGGGGGSPSTTSTSTTSTSTDSGKGDHQDVGAVVLADKKARNAKLGIFQLNMEALSQRDELAAMINEIIENG